MRLPALVTRIIRRSHDSVQPAGYAAAAALDRDLKLFADISRGSPERLAQMEPHASATSSKPDPRTTLTIGTLTTTFTTTSTFACTMTTTTTTTTLTTTTSNLCP